MGLRIKRFGNYSIWLTHLSNMYALKVPLQVKHYNKTHVTLKLYFASGIYKHTCISRYIFKLGVVVIQVTRNISGFTL